ncbi:MAG: hypothetical protein ACO22R_09020, partial [Chitinophagaceae bacterium]
MARGAVSAIKQGCELYNQFKGEVVQAKKTIDEAKGIVKEVGGFFGLFKRKNAVQERVEPVLQAKRKPESLDEAEIKKSIA